LGVLRVLTEQTLEISSVVKDPTFPDPSLAKEVKDSSLTILHQFRFIAEPLVQAGRRLRSFPAERAHCWEKINSIWIAEGDLRILSFLGDFPCQERPFSSVLGGVSLQNDLL
jgi:hypothetical protein